jgi:hypothetical protein
MLAPETLKSESLATVIRPFVNRDTAVRRCDCKNAGTCAVRRNLNRTFPTESERSVVDKSAHAATFNPFGPTVDDPDPESL